MTQTQTTATTEGADNEICLEARNLSVRYGKVQAVKDISLVVRARQVTALIGPSGCGKSTFLRAINRMNDLIPTCVVQGSVRLGETEIYDPAVEVEALRARIGMVFQKPNPFATSIYNNVAYGPRVQGLVRHRRETDERVEKSLRRAGLWDEVKDRLKESGTSLSGGQQQRLCIARAIAADPEVVLMDEPCSALDPIATARIEDLMDELRARYTIVIVTHSMQQAARVSKRTAFFLLGELVEEGATGEVFTNPQDERTLNYVTGRMG